MKRLILIIVAAAMLSGCLTDLAVIGGTAVFDFVVAPEIVKASQDKAEKDKAK